MFLCECPRAGRQAYIGLGFQQRSDAFDFNAALADHAKPAEAIDFGPMEDLSLKAGETIRIKVPVVATGSSAPAPAPAPAAAGGFKLGGGLAPPTSAGRSKYGAGGPPAVPASSVPALGRPQQPTGGLGRAAPAPAPAPGEDNLLGL